METPLRVKRPHPWVQAFTGKLPFSEIFNSNMVVLAITTGDRPKRPTHPSFTDRLWKLVQQCWREEPRDRPRIDQVIIELSVFPLRLGGTTFDALPASLFESSDSEIPQQLRYMADAQPNQELVNNLDKESPATTSQPGSKLTCI